MRFAHLADLHLTERPSKSDVPLEEQEEILGRIATVVNESAVDVVLIAGDCYDGTSTPRERMALRTFLDNIDGPEVRIIYGNHDAPLDLELFHSVMHDGEYCELYSTPGVVQSKGSFFGYDLAVAPWPRVRNAEGYAAIVRGLRAQCGDKCVLLAHCDLVGAELDGGQDTTGKVDAVISASDLEEMQWSYCALGHYHKRQLHPWGGYAGGIRPMKFGDDSRKGVVIVDLETGKREEIDCAGYELKTVGFADAEDLVDRDRLEGRKRAVGKMDRVRIRYPVAEEKQQAAYSCATMWAEELRPRCRSVSIEPEVIPTVRVRAPEIAAAKTDEEVLRAYLATTGSTRVEEIVEKSEVLK